MRIILPAAAASLSGSKSPGSVGVPKSRGPRKRLRRRYALPMPFGRSMLPLWPLKSAATYLNHGTVGVVPIRVAEAHQALRARIGHPSKFMLRDLWTFLDSVPRD